MPLTAIAVKNAKPFSKTRKIYDERGLYLEISPKGGKWWRFKYRFTGKEKRISLGVYPDISLADARVRRDDARKQVANGIDPSEARKATKLTQSGSNTFEAIAREWHTKHKANWSESHGVRILRRLDTDIFPWLGSFQPSDITPPQLLTVIRKIESRGALETAHRALQNCGQIFRYAVATCRAERDPAADLKGALPPVQEKHHPSITDPKKIGELLRVIDGYEGTSITKHGLQLAPITFVRPGELRHAEWEEIDFDNAEWRIPAEKMKGKVAHIVPLSQQAIDILNEIHPLTSKGKYIFPSVRSNTRPMSENTINAALRRLGYTKDEMTGHGFRSIASTLLNEQGWNRDAIERQLAHTERNNVRAAYNYADYLPERRKMMQAWSDYLDKLKNSNNN